MMCSQRTSRSQHALVTQLRVADPVVTPGGTVCGEVVVATGATPARLDTLTLALLTEIPGDDSAARQLRSPRLPRVLAKEPLAPHVTVASYQTRVLPFSLPIPHDTPLSLGAQRVVLRAVPELFADDPGEGDTLTVRPHPLMERVFSGLEELGFWLSGVDYVPLRRPCRGFPYTQRFTFRPPGRFQRRTASLQLWFALNDAGLETTLELTPPALRQPGARAERRQARLMLLTGREWDRFTPRLQRLIERRIEPALSVAAGWSAPGVRQ